MIKMLSTTCLLLSLASCGGEVTSIAAASSGGSGGAASASSTGDASSSSSGAGTGGGAPCGPQSDGTGGFMPPTCKDLGVLTVSDPVVIDDGGNGQVEAGEGATLKVNLNEVAGVGFSYYPGVIFTSSDPAVSVSSNDWLYAILACQTAQVTAHAAFGGAIPKGTVVTITARAAMLNQDCPDAYAIDIPITVH